MQWTNIVLWVISVVAAAGLIISATTRRERTLIEVLRDIVEVAKTPPEAESADGPPQTADNSSDPDAGKTT